MRKGNVSLVSHLLLGSVFYILINSKYAWAEEEGDSCVIRDLPGTEGVCMGESKCEPRIVKYITSGKLTSSQVPSCGLGIREEIVCCPVQECCPTDPSATTVNPNIPNMMELNLSSPYYDFQQLLNGKQKPQKEDNDNLLIHQGGIRRGIDDTPSHPNKAIQRRPKWEQNASLLDSQPQEPNIIVNDRPKWEENLSILGSPREPNIIVNDRPKWEENLPILGSPREPNIIINDRPKWEENLSIFGRPRQPKIIVNRPPSRPIEWDPINLVNQRLRQHGMDIERAKEVSSLDELMNVTPSSTTTTTTTTTTARIIAEYVDPFAPFRFQAKEQTGLVFGDTTTTTRTINPTPTTRVDVPRERAVVKACNAIQGRVGKDSLTPHILEGIAVNSGVYPHMAAIAFSSFGSSQFRCGGSLIAARFVLTAAHCVNEETPIFVRLGSVNLESPSSSYQDISISNITIHQDYVSSSKYHDIAILELAEEPNLGEDIYPACLETNPSDPPANASLFVAGWGVKNQTTRAQSKILLRAALENVNLDKCNELFNEQPSSRKALKQGVIDSLLCAADKRRQKADACQGDSGGPLIYEHNLTDGNYTIIGIISSGFGCATKTPGLYTRVASYLDFIESVVWPENRNQINDL